MMVSLKDLQTRQNAVKPVLIFAYGNVSLGDDALGPLLLDYLGDKINDQQVDLLNDFQLQVEHALDLENRQLVLFIDAAVNCKTAFNFTRLESIKDNSYSTHAMSPNAVLQVYQEITKQQPPPCFLLSIQGIRFELGESLSQQASSNLQQAICFTERLLETADVNVWNQKLDNCFA